MDGGAAINGLLMQIQADLLGTRLVRPTLLETTALGAALLAGLGAGVFDNLDDIRATWKADASFEPVNSESARTAARTLWAEGLKRV